MKRNYEKRKNDFDYFEVFENGKHIHKNGNYHLTDGHRDIIPSIKRNMVQDDIFMRLAVRVGSDSYDNNSNYPTIS